METPTKSSSNVLSNSNRRDSRIFSFRKNLSFDDPHQAPYSQHATTLFHTDSGYNSTNDSLLSPFSSPISNHGSHHRNSAILGTTHSHLEPILEAMESPSSTPNYELTPSTRHQLDRLSSFHITTPSSPLKKRASTTPLKLIDDASINKSRRTTPSKDSPNVTPRKQMSAYPASRRQSFRSTLDSLSENDENQPSGGSSSFHSDRMEFSPIIGQRHVAFERKRSEHTLQSSTPIDSSWLSNRVKGYTGQKIAPAVNAKSRCLRKTQSFSPSKHFQTKFNKEIGRISTVVLGLPSPKLLHSPVSNGLAVNPARKLLDFSCSSFDALVQCKDSNPNRPVLQRQTPVVPEMDLELDTILSPSKPADISSVTTTPVSSPSSNRSILSHPSFDILLNSAIIPEEPSFAPVCQPLMLTPKKPSQIAHYTSPARREANNIVYPHLPCTPPKSASKRPYKQTASAKKMCRSPVKRKLYDSHRRQHLSGMTRIDMLGRLEGVLPATDLIFRLLSTDDLVNCRQVSRRWCRIVESNARALHRVERNARRQEVCKENTDIVRSTPVPLPGIACGKSRVPFARCNSLAGSAHAPVTPAVVSPKTKAFLENQKIVKTISKSQRLMKCPRCNSSSIVDRITDSQSTPTTDSHETPLSTRSHLFRNTAGQLKQRTPNLGMLAKHQSFPIPFRTPTSMDWSSMEDSGFFGVSLDSHHLITPASHAKRKAKSRVEFGQCTKEQCGFRFCVSCLCDLQDDDHECRTVNESSHQRHRNSDSVACSKQSKRNLRRLMIP